MTIDLVPRRLPMSRHHAGGEAPRSCGSFSARGALVGQIVMGGTRSG